MQLKNMSQVNGRNVSEELSLTEKEKMVVLKYRQAKRLAELGHRSRMEIMFYDDGKACDMTIEDRERIVERLTDRNI